VLVLLAAGLSIGGCSAFAYYNRAAHPASPPAPRATFEIREDRGQRDVLVLLALSGGGSRAAYFSGAVMLRLQTVFPDVDLLQEVDVISSVSGGSLPAAYYAVSRDRAVRLRAEPPPTVRQHARLRYDVATRELALDGRLAPAEAGLLRDAFTEPADRHQFDRLLAQQAAPSNRVWDAPTVKDLTSRNYISRWIANWFWPDNIVLYWFTAYDRSDIMAQTFADNLYDVRYSGRDLTFRDINPERPYLILNATNGTEKHDPDDSEFGSVFTYTREDFQDRARSDIGAYFIARAVMASAAFPVVFNYVTLRDYRSRQKHYLHLFDGGTADNLGLTSLKRILLDARVNAPDRYRKIVVILVDAYVRAKGVDRDAADGRCPFCYVADMNAMDAVDSLLETNRANVLQDFIDRFNVYKDCSKGNLPSAICTSPGLERQIAEVERKLFFYHVRFEDSRLKSRLEKIPTHFRITEDEAGQPNTVHIDAAVDELINERNECLRYLRRILKGDDTAAAAPPVRRYCTWP
jgi:predicted acylesterase/phospholipase RssA